MSWAIIWKLLTSKVSLIGIAVALAFSTYETMHIRLVHRQEEIDTLTAQSKLSKDQITDLTNKIIGPNGYQVQIKKLRDQLDKVNTQVTSLSSESTQLKAEAAESLKALEAKAKINSDLANEILHYIPRQDACTDAADILRRHS